MEKESKNEFKPMYKHLSFDSAGAFEKWLDETTFVEIQIGDKGQDFVRAYVAKNGEIIHTPIQAAIWNGRFIDIKNLKEGSTIKIDKKYQDSSSGIWAELDLVVEKLNYKTKGY